MKILFIKCTINKLYEDELPEKDNLPRPTKDEVVKHSNSESAREIKLFIKSLPIKTTLGPVID